MKLPEEVICHILSYEPELLFLVNKELHRKYLQSTAAISYQIMQVPSTYMTLCTSSKCLYDYSMYVKWIDLNLNECDVDLDQIDFSKFKSCLHLNLMTRSNALFDEVFVESIAFDLIKVYQKLGTVEHLNTNYLHPSIALNGIQHLQLLAKLEIAFLSINCTSLNSLPNLQQLVINNNNHNLCDTEYDKMAPLRYITTLECSLCLQRDIDGFLILFPQLQHLIINKSKFQYSTQRLNLSSLILESLTYSGDFIPPQSLSMLTCSTFNKEITLLTNISGIKQVKYYIHEQIDPFLFQSLLKMLNYGTIDMEILLYGTYFISNKCCTHPPFHFLLNYEHFHLKSKCIWYPKNDRSSPFDHYYK